MLIRYINKFQKSIIKIIMVMMVFVILSSMLEITWILVTDFLTPPYLLIGVDQILDIFALFFLVIIGIELLETVKMIIIESSMNVDVIILVGITAIVRKILIIDLKNTDPLFLVGMGILIVALAGTYYLVVNSEKDFKCQLNVDDEH
ncbi:phosphate-starvation-inducible PsiE family protein [Methanolobus tindarius DSM 2278]|uniref:Phosphate-starvation-inducible PsiE family protein n=1 Tax=Methanolobus tindarius DSM 2278 TaxID=1090322 RepID=W9DSX6_METTI|nr:phosphate-starvation-inducible PsiE family protein [Methanolobus tindarius]ETA68715.1 phosphate-starvation-inducible PsiE family protein [Methanolobus tindarius DSM 2278]